MHMKSIIQVCAFILALLVVSPAAAVSSESMGEGFRAQIIEARSVLSGDPENMDAQKKLADNLRYLSFSTPGNAQAVEFLRESCGIYQGRKTKLATNGMAGEAAESASALISRDRSDQESYRIAQSILQILREIPTEPESDSARGRGVLASNLAGSTKEPKQQTALYAEAQKVLRAHIAAAPKNIERGKRALANSLLWEAALSKDASVKKTRYAEAQALLDTIPAQRQMPVNQVLLWQFQARDAADAKTRDALLGKVEQMAQAGLAQEKDPVKQSLYYAAQAVNAALKDDAASSLVLLKKAMQSNPDRRERYEMFIRHSRLYEGVLNNPSFKNYTESLSKSNSVPASQAASQ